MATRKTKSPASKQRKQVAPAESRAVRPVAEPAATTNSNRMLREAAWSRMFGRVESKNPFTR
jgi:hypothetical protein